MVFLLPVVIFITLDCFGVSCKVLEILAVDRSAFSTVDWNLEWSTKHQKICLGKLNSNIAFLRNPDLSTQDNPQTLL